MRNRRVSGICDRCKEKIYGDNWGPLGHKCRPNLVRWQVFNDKGELIRSYEMKLDATSFCEELNSHFKKGHEPYKVLCMREVVPSFGDKL